jgi:molybdopterin/thiamine biosynthesis adenylyltransferase/rhodanese-related sulfurtransferase
VNRYSRQIALPNFGEEGQRKLRQSSVLIVGAGGLGSPAALYLAAAGIGRLGLVDFDRVDVTNLHRQILYATRDAGAPKLDAARARLRDLNDDVDVVTHEERLTSDNALRLVENYDVILDGTDNFPTRYLVNDACVILGKPNVYGSVFRFEGQASVFDATRGPCYRCLYPEAPPAGLVPSCEEGGVLGVLPGIVGTIQATEAIKLIAGIGEPLIGRLLMIDALRMEFREVKLRAQHERHAAIESLIDYEEFCGPHPAFGHPLPEGEGPRSGGEGDDALMVDVREPSEWDAGHIDGAIHIPLAALPARMNELPRDRDLVVYCAMGGRSARAVEMLRSAGFTRVSNLTGGYQAWTRSQ